MKQEEVLECDIFDVTMEMKWRTMDIKLGSLECNSHLSHILTDKTFHRVWEMKQWCANCMLLQPYSFYNSILLMDYKIFKTSAQESTIQHNLRLKDWEEVLRVEMIKRLLEISQWESTNGQEVVGQQDVVHAVIPLQHSCRWLEAMTVVLYHRQYYTKLYKVHWMLEMRQLWLIIHVQSYRSSSTAWWYITTQWAVTVWHPIQVYVL